MRMKPTSNYSRSMEQASIKRLKDDRTKKLHRSAPQSVGEEQEIRSMSHWKDKQEIKKVDAEVINS